MAFDPETSLEGIFASLVCAAEEILIDVFKATVHKATNPAVRRLMELILRDEVRHIAFGWQCLDAWAPSFTPETVRNIEAAVTAMIENVEFRGYRNLWLAIEGGSATPAEIDADRISCEAGLGGNTPEDEMQIFPEFLREDPQAHGAVGREHPDVRSPAAGQGVAPRGEVRRRPAPPQGGSAAGPGARPLRRRHRAAGHAARRHRPQPARPRPHRRDRRRARAEGARASSAW